MLSSFDSFVHLVLENEVPLYLKDNKDGTYSFTDAKGNPQLGGKSYDKEMADRILQGNRQRIAASQEPAEELPEEPETESLPIRGEYWFDESGYAQYADGDVGDMNHEAYVIQSCAGELAAYFNVNLDMKTIYEVEDDIIEYIKDEV